MGVYSANRTYSFGGIDPDTIVANENYTNAVDAELILIENHQNDMAIFEAVLANDFREAVAVNEGTLLESEMVAITEGAIGDFFNKIKEFIKKVWEKIKGIFRAFMIKINSVVMKDNKEFVNKYKKEVLNKDLSKMKYKWAKKTGNGIDTCPWERSAVEEIYKIKNDEKAQENVDKLHEKQIEDDTLLEQLLKKSLGNRVSTTLADYAKDAHEWEWEDEDTEEGLAPSRLNDVMNFLMNASTVLKDLNKEKDNTDRSYSEMIKEIDKEQKSYVDLMPVKDGETVTKKREDGSERKLDKLKVSAIIAKLNLHQKYLQVYQTVNTKAVQAKIDSVKYEIKQARTVFAKAAAFNPKSVKENAVFVEAAGEAAAYEVESLIESYI